MAVTIMNLATPKAGAKHDLLFNKLASVLMTFSMLTLSMMTPSLTILKNSKLGAERHT
jgi:hypothetical protein